MTSVSDICKALGQIAPVCLAADWDNVGLLVGDWTLSLAYTVTVHCNSLVACWVVDGVHLAPRDR